MANPFSLHVERMGEGPEVLLAFHGIGQTGRECFQDWVTINGSFFTTYAVDLPFHGKSRLTSLEGALIEGDVVEEWLVQFLGDCNINRFSVLGYSIGGRFALTVLQRFATRIDRVFLVAPDGIRSHFIYPLATNTRLVRCIFRSVLNHPNYLIQVATFLERLQIISTSEVKLTKHMIGTPDKANQVYNAWVGFRHLKADLQYLALLLEQYQIDLHVAVGQYDSMVSSETVRPLLQAYPKAKLYVLTAGHGSVLRKFAYVVHQQLFNVS